MADKQPEGVSPQMQQFLQQEQARAAIRQTVATMTDVFIPSFPPSSPLARTHAPTDLI